MDTSRLIAFTQSIVRDRSLSGEAGSYTHLDVYKRQLLTHATE